MLVPSHSASNAELNSAYLAASVVGGAMLAPSAASMQRIAATKAKIFQITLILKYSAINCKLRNQ